MTSHSKPLVQLSAYEDIAAILHRIERLSGKKSADRIVDRILSAIDLLATTPYMGPLHHDPMLARLGYRKLVIGQYVVVYRVDEGQATVLRVFHGRSDYTSQIGE